MLVAAKFTKISDFIRRIKLCFFVCGPVFGFALGMKSKKRWLLYINYSFASLNLPSRSIRQLVISPIFRSALRWVLHEFWYSSKFEVSVFHLKFQTWAFWCSILLRNKLLPSKAEQRDCLRLLAPSHDPAVKVLDPVMDDDYWQEFLLLLMLLLLWTATCGCC